MRCLEIREKDWPITLSVCYNTKQAQKLQNMNVLCGVDVSVAQLRDPTNKGCDCGVELEIPNEELLEELSDQVKQVKRITCRSGGNVTPHLLK